MDAEPADNTASVCGIQFKLWGGERIKRRPVIDESDPKVVPSQPQRYSYLACGPL